MTLAANPPKKAYKSLPLEGMLATWYAKNTASLLHEFEAEADRLAQVLRPHSDVLEVAPGPGYLAIALARRGSFRIASENAAKAGVGIAFRHGDAADMPYPANAFDFIVCRAAFKNFSDPVGAMREMHRVLRPGGQALIIDMRRDASNEAIDETVDGMKLGPVNALFVRAVFRYSLRKRAYSRADFLGMAEQTPFGGADIKQEPLGFEVRLRK